MKNSGVIAEPVERDGNFLVVGLGASAGGITALREFFANVPVNSGVAYIVILHLSPDHDSKLAEVLQGVARIPVRQVSKRTKVEPDHVYVVPPSKSLGLDDGHITLRSSKSLEERRAPVDIFLRKLGEIYESRAVAVILSGTGANGSMGLKRVKELGGAAFVQNPREAEFNEMPRNSIATELVDSILPVAEIPKRLLDYRDRMGAVSIPEEPKDRADVDQQALREIFTHLRVRTGHDFSSYKRATILRRIERRISVRNLPDLQSYAAYLKETPEEPQALLKDLLISVTNFFRDEKAWQYLESSLFPRLLQERRPDAPIRIWVAACATGEEAYSIAMIAAEQAVGLPEGPAVQIFATDIDEQAIAIAREGIYTLNDAADVSAERLRRFFQREGDSYRIRRELREMILFANHNLTKDPPFSHLDLVTCRNLLIYLNQPAQERVLETAHFALRPGGYLFIGTSESVDGAGDLFAPVSKENHVYQSRPVATRTLPIPESTPVFRTAFGARPDVHAHDTLPPRERITYSELHLQLLEELAPPSVVVNEDYDIVHISESAGKYMSVAGGEPTKNLLKLAVPDIRLELRTSLFQAVQHRTNVETKNIRVKTLEGEETVNILVRPVFEEKDTSRGFVLVVFEHVLDGAEEQRDAYEPPEPVAQQLEEELIRSKVQLRAALEQAEVQAEELRASNEELQAMNEELRSSAEELETSKEELQSINEELTTVNQELKIKIEELSYSNTNFQNLLNSIDIGTIFLDRSMHVRLFSPASRTLFNLIPSDIGRPLSDITSRFEDASLLGDAENVLETLQTSEREVHTRDGQTYVMRILPYRTSDDRINGVILIFVDITARKRMEAMVRAGEERLRRLMESFTDFAIFTTDTEGRVRDWNTGAEVIYGFKADEIVGKSADVVFTPEDRAANIPDKERASARRKMRSADERWQIRKSGERFCSSGVMVPLIDADDKLIGYAKIVRDMTERLRAEEAVAERERLHRLVQAQEDERHRIARDLHDQLGQRFTALRLKIEDLRQHVKGDRVMLKAVEQTQALAQQIDNDVSFLAWELRPQALDARGLINALDHFIAEWSRNYRIRASFDAPKRRRKRLHPDIEISYYRITQEALNNVLKHSGASKVDVKLAYDGELVLTVRDNGKGFDPRAVARKTKRQRLGLVGMRERAAMIGGTVEIDSARGKGTTVNVRCPLRSADK